MTLQMESLIAQLVILALLAAIVVSLALYRMLVARKQDFHIHINASEAPVVGEQAAIDQKLGWIDKWGKTLTIVTVVYFFALLAMVCYQQWIKSASLVSLN
jgi:hypothetical protein